MDGDCGGMESASRLLLIEEVERIISQAAAGGGILHIGRHAKQLGDAHKATGLSHKGIADELIGAAARAGIPIEISGAD
jgi:hypothetical protein